MCSSVLTRRWKHRVSGFDTAWCREYRAWLEVVRDEVGAVHGILCQICRDHGKPPRSGRGVWTTVACRSFRKDKLNLHANSSMHKAARIAYLEKQQSMVTGGISQAFQDVMTAERKAVIGCCKCIHWLCKHDIPHTTNNPSLLALAEDLGCKYFEALKVGRNAMYTSPQIVGEFLKVMDRMTEEIVLEDIRQSDTYSIMVDESTDIRILKQLVCYGRAVVEGKLKTHFLMITDLPDGKADTITSTLTQYLSASGLNVDALSSFGSDGARVMTGNRTGVASRLKQLNCQMIPVHCICHRLVLACGQAGNEVKYLRQVKDGLLTLWKYF